MKNPYLHGKKTKLFKILRIFFLKITTLFKEANPNYIFENKYFFILSFIIDTPLKPFEVKKMQQKRECRLVKNQSKRNTYIRYSETIVVFGIYGIRLFILERPVVLANLFAIL